MQKIDLYLFRYQYTNQDGNTIDDVEVFNNVHQYNSFKLELIDKYSHIICWGEPLVLKDNEIQEGHSWLLINRKFISSNTLCNNQESFHFSNDEACKSLFLEDFSDIFPIVTDKNNKLKLYCIYYGQLLGQPEGTIGTKLYSQNIN